MLEVLQSPDSRNISVLLGYMNFVSVCNNKVPRECVAYACATDPIDTFCTTWYASSVCILTG